MAWNRVECAQGQRLQWLGYDPRADRHGFGVAPGEEPSLCAHCWVGARCPREFACAPGDPESLLGLWPLARRPAQALLQQVRPWIEPTQSYAKNQRGLNQMFWNSLRFTWCLALLADAVAWLRTHALRHAAPEAPVLRDLASPRVAGFGRGEPSRRHGLRNACEMKFLRIAPFFTLPANETLNTLCKACTPLFGRQKSDCKACSPIFGSLKMACKRLPGSSSVPQWHSLQGRGGQAG